MPEKVYVLFGYCGDVGDSAEWEVAAYFDREAAQIHLQKAQEVADKENASKYSWDSDKDITWDSQKIKLSWGRVQYSIREVSLFSHPDEYLDRNGK